MNDCATTSRNIPLPIQRKVRQRCGFGCVLCGFPLYEYDHLKGWANVHEHKAADITLLCDRHHKEVTNGLLPREKIIKANDNPFNKNNKESSNMLLHFEGNDCEVVIGNNNFKTSIKNGYAEMIPILIDDIPLIGFIIQDQSLLLNINFFDEFNHEVLRIKNNHLFYNQRPWDIQFVGKNLIIREKERKILINMTFEPPNKIIINNGRLLFNGIEILINKNYIAVNNGSILSGCSSIDCHCGLSIGRNNKGLGSGWRMENVSRLVHKKVDIKAIRKNLKLMEGIYNKK